jgi:hypothetical protein
VRANCIWVETPHAIAFAHFEPANTHVDHFRGANTLSGDHNFVLADRRSNSRKRDRLPACDHLATWTERNARFGEQIGKALEERGIVSQLAASNRVTQWAYGQTEAAHGLTWSRAVEVVPLAPE